MNVTKCAVSVAAAAAAASLFFLPGIVSADTVGPINFESPTYTVGSISGQDGWSSAVNPTYDQAVVATSTLPASFGAQSFRMSDAVTSGTFGDWVFAKPLINSVGETSATAGSFAAGTKQTHFEVQFDIMSTQATQQPGMHLSVSPDRGDGSRMSYLRFDDLEDGIHVFFDDVTDPGPVGTTATFNEYDVGTISRTAPHTIKLTMDVADGAANDVVKVYIDGVLKHTGGSWEDFYRYDPEQSSEQSPRIVKTVIFQARGTATPADLGKGYYIDNLSLLSGPTPVETGTIVITKYACPDGTTVTRAANGVGQTVPTGCVPDSGKTFGYVHGTQIDANAPYPELSAPLTAGGATNGSGVLTIPNLPATGRYLVVETDSSNQQLAAGDILGLYCQGDGDTSNTNDNQELTFVSPNATVNCVAYDKIPPPVKVTIDKFLNGSMATAASASSTSFSMTATWNSTSTGEGTGSYALGPIGFNSPNPYEAVTVDMTPGASYTTSENSPTTCDAGNPFALVGYTAGATLAAAEQGTPTADAPNFTNLQSDEYVIVWNKTCIQAPTLKVHVLKYLNGQKAAAASANNYQFPMTAVWQAANLNGGATSTGNYVLGNNFGGAADLYGADTAPMQAPANYGTAEVTDTASQVVASPALCTPGKYLLDGYKTSSVSFADAASQATTTAVNLYGLAADEYVLVYNESCPTTGGLIVEKDTVGGNGTFKFTGDLGSFQITTTGNATGGTGSSQTFANLAPGTYHVSETPTTGWTLSDNECSSVVIAAGAPTTCIVTNTKNPKLGEIRGVKFEDWDGGGRAFESPWEKKLSGWTIYLDTNNNGILDPGEPSTVTDSHGAYRFTGLAAGTYHVREVQQTGWTSTYPSKIAISDTYDIALAAGQIAKNKNFGNFKLGTISGEKYNDKNGNGHKDNGEGGLAGWTIQLKKPDGSTISTVTDANGNYSFANLGPGVYKLSEVSQAGWRQTDHPGPVLIYSGAVSKHDDFGNTQKAITHGLDNRVGWFGWGNGRGGNT
ncbi:MAG: SdrD B-like domain-containing protein [Minisyncoccia bacterium]